MKFLKWVKLGFSDPVDALIFIVSAVAAVADLGFNATLTGGYAFLSVCILSLIIRMGYWKWKYLNK